MFTWKSKYQDFISKFMTIPEEKDEEELDPEDPDDKTHIALYIRNLIEKRNKETELKPCTKKFQSIARSFNSELATK